MNMKQALYRKYRSKSLAEIVGQPHITTTLEKAIRNDKLSHAYLFTGPKGVGKTSVARIMAHEINELDYDEATTHLDIIEIDAASNRRIDEIRDLRDKVHVAPSSARYKVYIVDEVHMLTREAFNALLKTLEEPPAHVIFILATTEVHKVPATIVSRTQRFTFKPIAPTDAIKHLRVIADQENLVIDDEALQLLADYGEGSFRDSISLLDQLSNFESISASTVRDLIGIPPATSLEELATAIIKQQPSTVLTNLSSLTEQGYTAVAIASALGKYLRQTMTDKTALRLPNTSLLKELLQVSASQHPEELLEIILLEAAQPPVDAVGTKIAPLPEAPTQKDSHPTQRKTTKKETDASTAESVDARATKQKIEAEFSLEQWPRLLELAKVNAPTLYTALRLAQPSLKNNFLTLYFEFPLHQKKVQERHHQKILLNCLASLASPIPTISYQVDKMLFKPAPSAKPLPEEIKEEIAEASAGNFHAISNIFGGAEVLES